jgi:N-acetylmuramoyl-L-alanine amidase
MRLATVQWARRFLLVVAILTILAAAGLVWQSTGVGGGSGIVQRLLGLPAGESLGRVGIVAGHSGNDSGAVCPDGLTEAQVNQAVANAVARTLRRRGATVDLLQEFDPRLQGYQADAFVSIHADSCEADLSGYKVASLEGGSDASERLSDCLWERYGAATSVPPHPDTITYDMSRYHAFNEISPQTPAADRELIAEHPDRAAEGIVAGLECFLQD